jgi:two-component system nitrogen regulation sensor histidine kinase NtrY
VRLEDHATDELSLLIRSFNRMAADLAASRLRLTEANDLLERRNQYIEAVLDTIGAGVVSLDAEGHVGTMNKAARVMFGRESAPNAMPLPLNEGDEQYWAFFRLMEEGVRKSADGRWQQQIAFQHADREWTLLITAVRLDTSEGAYHGIVTVLDGITELERMQRMAAWREVARRIAHEIKNPLTPIKLSAQRLERKFSALIADPVFAQSTGLIVRQVEKLQDMV